jgi:hypothetical protein
MTSSRTAMMTALFCAIQVLRPSSNPFERSPSAKYRTTGTAAPSEAMTVKTTRAIACSSAGIPVPAIAAIREVRLDPFVQHGQLQVVQAGDLALERGLVAQVRVRRAPPETEPLA